jgi:predicted dehydrogenase
MAARDMPEVAVLQRLWHQVLQNDHMEQFKWGIIGPGNIAETFIGDMPLASSGSHTASVVLHKTKEKAEAFADKFGIGTSFDSIHDMVRAGGMDAVYIATPHPFHHKETLICLEHGIPVLCEKPLAINAVQVKEMIDTARRTNTFLLEGMWIRFLPSIIQVLDLVKKGTIGEIVSMHANLIYVAPKEPDSRYFDPERGGGSLLDLGIYPIYLAVLLMGRPVVTFARAKVNSNQIDEHCVVTMEFSKKKWAVCESSLISFTGNSASIHGTLGSIHIPKPWNEKPAAIELVDNEGYI